MILLLSVWASDCASAGALRGNATHSAARHLQPAGELPELLPQYEAKRCSVNGKERERKERGERERGGTCPASGPHA